MPGDSITVSAELITPIAMEKELRFAIREGGRTVGAGVISALRREGPVDQGVRFLTIGAIALPQFWIGLMLLWLFYERLKVAPGPVGRLEARLPPGRPACA